jgi:ribosomal protein L11 methyltransferase
MNSFIVLRLQTNAELAEILKAELAELGFDAFIDTDNSIGPESGSFETSIAEQDFAPQLLQELIDRYTQIAPVHYTTEKVARQNWNKLWEENYDPIIVDERCAIRAEFHAPQHRADGSPYPLELIINPKMSFGTGHHQTTSLMIAHQLEMDFAGKRVADLGCGTGVLAILALKLGAAHADACDIDEWPVENTLENAMLNGVQVQVKQGTVDELQFEPASYDVVLANINLHVLLAEMDSYTRLLKKGATLLLSGFYTHDLDAIQLRCLAAGLQPGHWKQKNNWVALSVLKPV